MAINWRKLLLSLFACAVGAWVGTVVGTYVFGVYMAVVPETLAERFLKAFSIAFGMGSILSILTFVAMAAIGLPLQHRMQKRGETGWWPHASSAMLGGMMASAVTIIGLFYVPAAMIAGFIAGSVFWLIRRPDKDENEKVVT